MTKKIFYFYDRESKSIIKGNVIKTISDLADPKESTLFLEGVVYASISYSLTNINTFETSNKELFPTPKEPLEWLLKDMKIQSEKTNEELTRIKKSIKKIEEMM